MLIRSLRTEIAVLALASILTTSALVLWFAVNSYEVLYQESARNDLNGLSENLSVDLITDLDNQDSFAISNTLLQLEQYENVRFAAVLNVKGKVLSSYLGKVLTKNKSSDEIILMPPIDFGQYHHSPIGMTMSQNSIFAKKIIGDSQSGLGFLIVENDLSGPLNSSKKNLLWSVIPWVILTLSVNIIVIVVFQNKALKPLIQLARFTKKVRDTNDYSLIAAVKGKREIVVVTKGINSMMNEINSEVEKNRQNHQLLLSQQKQMQTLANYDTLTGLANRQFFMGNLKLAIAEAKQQQSDAALLLFDLDGFKRVNDSFGHEVGDRLLRVITKRILKITDSISPNAEAARLGGDEFLVLIKNPSSDQQIVEIAKHFIEYISKPMNIDHWRVQVGASIGIAKAAESNFSVNELVANADIAMYQAKHRGRNRYEQFTDEMIEKSRRKLNIANAIDNALLNGEFMLFYQSKVDAEAQVVGYEALARWCNKELGHISPAEFIPIAEQSGKISKVTEWLIRQVCADINSDFQNQPQQRVALNLSAHDLTDKHLLQTLKQQMLEYKIRPEQLEFEITESAYLNNFNMANIFIEELKAIGCTIALDDFGTGYSSLSYLTQINIDTLKIDKQFVDKICISERDALITKAIIDMAKQLNIEVCAEGVETVEQAQKLIEYKCDILQGYFYGKPMDLEAIKALSFS